MQRLPATRQRVLKPFLHLPSSAAQMPPLCKGRWRGLPRRRDCFFFTSLQPTIPHPTSSGAPFAQGSLFIKTSCDFPFFAFSSSAKPLLNHAKGVMRPIAWFSFYKKGRKTVLFCFLSVFGHFPSLLVRFFTKNLNFFEKTYLFFTKDMLYYKCNPEEGNP